MTVINILLAANLSYGQDSLDKKKWGQRLFSDS